jgi:hypothetical protein
LQTSGPLLRDYLEGSLYSSAQEDKLSEKTAEELQSLKNL